MISNVLTAKLCATRNVMEMETPSDANAFGSRDPGRLMTVAPATTQPHHQLALETLPTHSMYSQHSSREIGPLDFGVSANTLITPIEGSCQDSRSKGITKGIRSQDDHSSAQDPHLIWRHSYTVPANVKTARRHIRCKTKQRPLASAPFHQ
jgi:hypothetical protein